MSEIVLKPQTKYLVVASNRSNNNMFIINAEWYEQGLGL